MKINVKCPPCMICGCAGRVEVEESDFYKWQGGYDTPGVLIQEAFPYLSEHDREMLMTGTHKLCWELFISELEEGNGPGVAASV